MDSRICYTCLLFVLIIGITAGNLLTDYARLHITAMALQSLSENPPLPVQPNTNDSNDKSKSGLGTAIRTCEFWKDAYAKDRTEKSRTYMVTACARVKEFQ